VKPWKRDLAYIREVGPDEPRFDEAVQRVWDRVEELEAALRQIDAMRTRSQPDGLLAFAQACNIAREALS
jgi:hypothetical protein